MTVSSMPGLPDGAPSQKSDQEVGSPSNADATSRDAARKQTACSQNTSTSAPAKVASFASGHASLVSLADEEQFNKEDMDVLKKDMFIIDKWNKGRAHLEKMNRLNNKDVKAILRQGAKKFGFWHLSDFTLAKLVEQLVEPNDHKHAPSNAISNWNEKVKEIADTPHTEIPMPSVGAKTPQHDGKKARKGWIFRGDDEDVLRAAYAFFTAVFLSMSVAMAIQSVTEKYPKAIDILGWPFFIARAGGLGCTLWTGLIYWTMSREFLSWVTAAMIRCGIGASRVAVFHAHKEIHVFAGKALFVTSVAHTITHGFGTVPGILKCSVAELNDFLGCALDDPAYIAKMPLEWARWPACPIEKVPEDFTEVLWGTMPGFTGGLLVVLLCIITYTSMNAYRKANYDWFWYLHNIAIIFWPILLFFHGSQGWVGVGFPLVLPVCGVPLLLCLHYRIKRTLRYYLFAGTRTVIERVTIRPGFGGKAKGALTNMKITKPPFLWTDLPGTYAFISMPEYAPLQWHAFTICSGMEDDTVNFIIAGVGDWSMQLAQRCLDAEDGSKLPKIALDGPYMAPAQTALNKKVLVCVGAGVGVTPFLSIMSSFMSLSHDTEEYRDPPLLEAHFFWMARGADEFLLARTLLAGVVRHPKLREKMFIHLYATAKGDEQNPASILFREAVKRQSACDRKAFNEGMSGQDKRLLLMAGSQVPHCWARESKHDVLWVREVIRQDALADEVTQSDSQDFIDMHGLTEAHVPQFFHLQTPAALDRKGACSVLDGDKIKTPAPPRQTPKSPAPETPDSQDSKTSRTSYLEEEQWTVPIMLGRPDFASEIRGIGLARPDQNVHVYVCGNDMLVDSLQEVVKSCNQKAEKDAKAQNLRHRQKYNMHIERFG